MVLLKSIRLAARIHFEIPLYRHSRLTFGNAPEHSPLCASCSSFTEISVISLAIFSVSTPIIDTVLDRLFLKRCNMLLPLVLALLHELFGSFPRNFRSEATTTEHRDRNTRYDAEV